MRRILATSLLLPSLFLPAVVKASTLDDASAPTPKVRVSTGVVSPELLNADQFSIPVSATDQAIPGDATVGLSLTVSEDGRPQNVKVVKSLNPVWDARVVDAVNHAHFKPGSIDTQAIPVDLNLTVNIAR
jgi:TonB family protein